jgi:hypothetical protein
MNSTPQEQLALSGEEMAILAELLDTERDRLLIEIRHTDARSFREELRRRLEIIEHLAERCHSAAHG